jgi:DNA-binding FrmR family transcriptional regulator
LPRTALAAVVSVLVHQAAAAARLAVFPEQDNTGVSRLPAVCRLFKKNRMNMKLKSPETKEQLIQRLRRIEGQVRGVQGMLDEERDCHEIMQQLSAIRSAVQSASRVFLQEYATECLLEPGEEQDTRAKREKVIRDMITMLDKAP